MTAVYVLSGWLAVSMIGAVFWALIVRINSIEFATAILAQRVKLLEDDAGMSPNVHQAHELEDEPPQGGAR
jgi:hypothetical protein